MPSTQGERTDTEVVDAAPGADATPCADRLRRSDARENRDRILAAAARAFADEGLGVSLIEIARRAGVGNATVHRNFTKEQLVEELFSDWYATRQSLAERALTDPDPWHGLVTFAEDLLGAGSVNRGIAPLFAVRPDWRRAIRVLIERLLVRAQNAGLARTDLTAEDVTLALLGVGRTITILAQVAPDQWRRHLAIVLDGMRAEHTTRLPGLAITPEQLDGELCVWGHQVLGSPAGH